LQGTTLIFDIKELQDKYTPPVNQCLIFDPIFIGEINIMTQRQYESGGALIYSVHNNNYQHRFVEYLQILNEPQSSFWTGKYDREKINNFRNIIEKARIINNWNLVWFHCHTVGTGAHWYDKFSEGDYNAFEKEADNYEHILFTPTKILTCSKEPIDVRIIRSHSEQIEGRRRKWEEALEGFN